MKNNNDIYLKVDALRIPYLSGKLEEIGFINAILANPELKGEFMKYVRKNDCSLPEIIYKFLQL